MEVHTAQPLEQRKVIRKTVTSVVPEEITQNAALNALIKRTLPDNYNFELHKIIWRLKQTNARRCGLQFPEGLFIFAVPIADILRQFARVEVILMGDVTYGACCVDDHTAKALGCDFLVHFAHSCLVPVNQMHQGLKVMYVFVDIKFDIWHFIETVKANLDPAGCRLALAATIQFVSSIHGAGRELEKAGYQVLIPQARPLSKGEVLGCTAPKLLAEQADTVVFVADGRFHLEAMMIANPHIDCFYRYNPYDKQLSQEFYAFDKMIEMRERAVRQTRDLIAKGCTFGLILGALGRQGSPYVYNNIRRKLKQHAPQCTAINVVIPEIAPALLNSFGDAVDVWVQVACPRLSIDWGEGFVRKPLLTPYEFNAALELVRDVEPGSVLQQKNPERSPYPMDFYAQQSLGDWTPNHKCSSSCSCDAATGTSSC